MKAHRHCLRANQKAAVGRVCDAGCERSGHGAQGESEGVVVNELENEEQHGGREGDIVANGGDEGRDPRRGCGGRRVVTQEKSECILCGHYPRIFFTRAHTTRTVRTWSTMSGRSSTPQGQAISIRSARKPEKVDQADGVAGGWEQLEMRPTTGTGKWPRE